MNDTLKLNAEIYFNLLSGIRETPYKQLPHNDVSQLTHNNGIHLL